MTTPQPLNGSNPEPPTQDQILESAIKNRIKLWWYNLEQKIGQKGLWLILAIVCMLVLMKVCF